MSFFEFLDNNWLELFALTREHIFIVLFSTLLAVAVGLPTGILLTRVKWLRTPVLGFANVMQTVPSLALFGLLIPLPFIGGIGAKTAIIALSLYALLPIIRNTVTGILGIDPKITEAATAMGMTGRQRLALVELPLAMPVILTGIRVAVVISVGVATVAAAIGAGGLGTYIFRGLRQNDNNLLLAGAIASALLAILFDLALGQFEGAYTLGERRNKKRCLIAASVIALALVAVPFTGLINSVTQGKQAGQKVVVGSKDFTESAILAEILSQMLERDGISVERQFELSGNLVHDALLSGRIDVYPEYTGTAFTAILKHAPVTDPQVVYDKTKAEYAERFDLTVSEPLGFANDFAILVRGETARKHNLKNISDAVPFAGEWQAGFGQDFMSRADGYPGFIKAYNIKFNKQPREMDLSLTYRALQSGELDIIAGNSTDGLITALDLFQLNDDRHYFPPYQSVYISRTLVNTVLSSTIKRLAGQISAEDMRKMNLTADSGKKSIKAIATEWLDQRY